MGFAENLKYLRKYRNLTQTKLAELANISTSSVINYENRRRKDPPHSVIESLAAALNVPTEMLTAGSIQEYDGYLFADIVDKYGFSTGGVGTGPNGTPSYEALISYITATERSSALHEIMNSLELLNITGLQEAVKRISELTEIQKYKLTGEEAEECRENEQLTDRARSRGSDLTDGGRLNTAPGETPEQEN